MKQEFKAKLTVNKKEIGMNPFVESFLAHVVLGIVNSLKGVDYIKTVDLKMASGEVSIMVNQEDITLTKFPNDVIVNTLKGLVTSLKGVDEVNTLEIKVEVK